MYFFMPILFYFPRKNVPVLPRQVERIARGANRFNQGAPADGKPGGRPGCASQRDGPFAGNPFPARGPGAWNDAGTEGKDCGGAGPAPL